LDYRDIHNKIVDKNQFIGDFYLSKVFNKLI